MRAAIAWIDARLPVRAMLRIGGDEEIPGGARFAYALGSATLFVFLLQVATGCLQLFYYVPTTDHAYDSVEYLRTQVPFGWLTHGLHYWGASAMVVLVGLHMIRVFVWGAYKHPRQLVWLAGVALFALTAGLMFSGAPLPWDERGYWAGEVGTSMAGTLPLAGDALKRLLRGGESMGQLALSRLFVLHVAILPALLVGVVLVHLAAFRMFGSVGPWKPSRRRTSGPFWPDQVFRDTLLCTAIFVLLVGLSAFAPPPITGPADPLDTSYVPRPEWNFVFLYKALQLFPGWLEPVGTVGIPLLGLVVLCAVPFADRRSERDPLRRPFAMGGMILVLAGGISFTVAGLRGASPGGAGSIPAAAPDPPEPGSAGSSAPSPGAAAGRMLFHQLGCIGCHRVEGAGGTVGPDLDHEVAHGRDAAWLTAQVRDPRKHFPGSPMPAYASLPPRQVGELVAFLTSLPGESGAAQPSAASTASGGASAPAAGSKARQPGPAAQIIGSAQHGALLFSRNCASCHGTAARGGLADPGSSAGAIPALNPVSRALFSSNPQTFAANLDRFLQHGGRPAGPHPALVMPAFGATHTLTQPEVADIEAYVMSLNGVSRGAIEHPGAPPRLFAGLAAALFGAAGAALGAAWLVIRRHPS